MAGKRSPLNPSISRLTSPHNRIASRRRRLRFANPNQIPDGTLGSVEYDCSFTLGYRARVKYRERCPAMRYEKPRPLKTSHKDCRHIKSAPRDLSRQEAYPMDVYNLSKVDMIFDPRDDVYFGFNIIGVHSRPLVTFSFETRKEADDAY
jgi:hypothetical protein